MHELTIAALTALTIGQGVSAWLRAGRQFGRWAWGRRYRG